MWFTDCIVTLRWGQPGWFTHVGLGTFIGPIHKSRHFNSLTINKRLVQHVKQDGRNQLGYQRSRCTGNSSEPTRPISFENLKMDGEVMIGKVLPIAKAAHNCDGLVIAQTCNQLACSLISTSGSWTRRAGRRGPTEYFPRRLSAKIKI